MLLLVLLMQGDSKKAEGVVLFMHGFAQGPNAYYKMLKEIADQGFLVVAPEPPFAPTRGKQQVRATRFCKCLGVSPLERATREALHPKTQWCSSIPLSAVAALFFVAAAPAFYVFVFVRDQGFLVVVAAEPPFASTRGKQQVGAATLRKCLGFIMSFVTPDTHAQAKGVHTKGNMLQ